MGEIFGEISKETSNGTPGIFSGENFEGFLGSIYVVISVVSVHGVRGQFLEEFLGGFSKVE